MRSEPQDLANLLDGSPHSLWRPDVRTHDLEPLIMRRNFHMRKKVRYRYRKLCYDPNPASIRIGMALLVSNPRCECRSGSRRIEVVKKSQFITTEFNIRYNIFVLTYVPTICLKT